MTCLLSQRPEASLCLEAGQTCICILLWRPDSSSISMANPKVCSKQLLHLELQSVLEGGELSWDPNVSLQPKWIGHWLKWKYCSPSAVTPRAATPMPHWADGVGGKQASGLVLTVHLIVGRQTETDWPHGPSEPNQQQGWRVRMWLSYKCSPGRDEKDEFSMKGRHWKVKPCNAQVQYLIGVSVPLKGQIISAPSSAWALGLLSSPQKPVEKTNTCSFCAKSGNGVAAYVHSRGTHTFGGCIMALWGWRTHRKQVWLIIGIKNGISGISGGIRSGECGVEEKPGAWPSNLVIRPPSGEKLEDASLPFPEHPTNVTWIMLSSPLLTGLGSRAW